ncbi:MAG: hypothetical protein LBR11_12655, partial [Deltaproteobacteria bacterium]|nr:hypothetical protein [Deltaproteobacteria bacterium]
MSISIDKDGNTLKISRQSKDIFLKTLVDNFSNLLVSTLEIHKAQNISVLPNELPIIEVSKAIMDRVLLIDNKNILNIEFDTSGLEENLVRYMFYAAVISQAYYKKYNTYQAVYTAVIYPGFVKLPTNIYTTEGSLLFTVKQIYVPDYINPNEIYNETIHLIQSGENLSLHKQNLLNFLLSPYGMTNYDDCKKFCEDILKFSLKTPQICNNDHIFSLVAASTASIIGDTDFFKDQMRSNERMKEAIDFLSGGLLSEYEDTI